MYLLRLFLLVITNLFFTFHSQESNKIQLKLNSTISNVNEDNGVTYYQLIIDSNQNKYDLMIMVKPTDLIKDFSDPDIFISKVVSS